MIWAAYSIISALFESASLAFERKALLKEHAMEFCASLSIFMLLFTSPLWYFAKPDVITLNTVLLTLVSSIAFCVSLFFFAKTTRHLAASYTNPFIALAPLLSMLGGVLFLGERLTFLQLVGALLLIFATYLMYAHTHKNIFEPIKKIKHLEHAKYIFLAAFFYAVMVVVQKKIFIQGSGIVNYFTLFFFFNAVVFILMMLLFHDGFSGIGNGMRGNFKLLSISAILTILYQVFIILALATSGVLVALAIPFKKLSSIFSSFFEKDFLHKEFLLRKIIAILLAVIGALLVLM